MPSEIYRGAKRIPVPGASRRVPGGWSLDCSLRWRPPFLHSGAVLVLDHPAYSEVPLHKSPGLTNARVGCARVVPMWPQLVEEELAGIDDSWKEPRFDTLPHVVDVLTCRDPKEALLELQKQTDNIDVLVDDVVSIYYVGFNKAIHNYSQVRLLRPLVCRAHACAAEAYRGVTDTASNPPPGMILLFETVLEPMQSLPLWPAWRCADSVTDQRERASHGGAQGQLGGGQASPGEQAQAAAAALVPIDHAAPHHHAHRPDRRHVQGGSSTDELLSPRPSVPALPVSTWLHSQRKRQAGSPPAAAGAGLLGSTGWTGSLSACLCSRSLPG